MDIQHISKAIDRYLRPQTFPIAIRLVNSIDEVPKVAKMPKRDSGRSVALCQGLALSRRYGWVAAMGGEDMSCPIGAIAMGFYKAADEFLNGSLDVPYWIDSREIRANVARNMPRLEHGKYSYIISAPLERTTFDPQLIIVNGDPAQVSRLMQANTCVTGEPTLSMGLGAFSCSAEIASPLMTGKCQAVVAGGGERSIAYTQANELCFSIPAGRIDAIVEGLEKTHRAGSRYPIPTYLDYEVKFPSGYAQLMQHLRDQR